MAAELVGPHINNIAFISDVKKQMPVPIPQISFTPAPQVQTTNGQHIPKLPQSRTAALIEMYCEGERGGAISPAVAGSIVRDKDKRLEVEEGILCSRVQASFNFKKRSSAPLEFIIPVSAKPPTQYLSKSNSSASNPASSAANPAVLGWLAARPCALTLLASMDLDFRFYYHLSLEEDGDGVMERVVMGESAERGKWEEKDGDGGEKLAESL
ncbi:hypothetical protein M378DRAFT_19102 [Amanita muscaria Koide BX008]|uniref:Uncharacterized protein n=1 Tax=Amanita muscaria (strain Koide BX008) TaxID=946122 RepID=A0A0C2WCD0_AMAMK|nr:hypothetical protein M378DRAFT_19102 [Amanita muscaria Koide BX008]